MACRRRNLLTWVGVEEHHHLTGTVTRLLRLLPSRTQIEKRVETFGQPFVRCRVMARGIPWRSISTRPSRLSISVVTQWLLRAQTRTTKWFSAGRSQLAEFGAAELSGFVSPDGVARLVEDADALVQRSHRSSGQGTAYLEVPDFSLPDTHPRLTWGEYSVGAVAYDVIPRTSPLRRLYEWAPMMALIADILDRGPLFPYADPFGALNLSIMGSGDQLQWHFDQTDFVVSLAIQSPTSGGDFELAPRIRRPDDECYDDVARVLGDDRTSILTLVMSPGTLLIFEGRYSLHRVSPISGSRLRYVGLLAYDTKPGTVGSELLRNDRYGRSKPFAEPPGTWPVEAADEI